MDGSKIRASLAMMNERGNGEGAGYASYGIYPEFKDAYALHVFFDDVKEDKPALVKELESWGTIFHDEPIPTYEAGIKKVHTPWRFFYLPDTSLAQEPRTTADDMVTELVMRVNTTHKGSLIFSSGKNMGVFKASGWPEQVANFYRIEDYKGYLWLAHNRYPTNTAGWWGGAHPFNLLDWSVVHNGEITSYGTNQRYIESTDTSAQCLLTLKSWRTWWIYWSGSTVSRKNWQYVRWHHRSGMRLTKCHQKNRNSTGHFG